MGVELEGQDEVCGRVCVCVCLREGGGSLGIQQLF